jgi:hypothetical protein
MLGLKYIPIEIGICYLIDCQMLLGVLHLKPQVKIFVENNCCCNCLI